MYVFLKIYVKDLRILQIFNSGKFINVLKNLEICENMWKYFF